MDFGCGEDGGDYLFCSYIMKQMSGDNESDDAIDDDDDDDGDNDDGKVMIMMMKMMFGKM